MRSGARLGRHPARIEEEIKEENADARIESEERSMYTPIFRIRYNARKECNSEQRS